MSDQQKVRRPWKRHALVVIDTNNDKYHHLLHAIQESGLQVGITTAFDHWVSDERLQKEIDDFCYNYSGLKNDPDAFIQNI